MAADKSAAMYFSFSRMERNLENLFGLERSYHESFDGYMIPVSGQKVMYKLKM